MLLTISKSFVFQLTKIRVGIKTMLEMKFIAEVRYSLTPFFKKKICNYINKLSLTCINHFFGLDPLHEIIKTWILKIIVHHLKTLVKQSKHR